MASVQLMLLLPLLWVQPSHLCMTVNWTLALSLCLARFLVDLWYFAQILITVSYSSSHTFS